MESDLHLEEEEFQTGGVILASAAHGVHDTYPAFLPALLPVLIEKFSLTNTTAGVLSLFMQIPSLLQPFIGQLADHANLRILVILAPAITGIAMSLLGVAPTYGFLAFLLILAGISSSSLHAVGPAILSHLSHNRLGKGLSFWMVGGELGRSLGPVIVASVISYLTLEKLPWLMLAGIFASIFFYFRFKSIAIQTIQHNGNTSIKAILPQMRGIMLPLSAVIFSRSLMAASISLYLPTFLTSEGASLMLAGASLTILQFAGVTGAFLAGPLSDRFGRRKLLVISYIATPIFMFLFSQSNAFWHIPFLILTGFFGISVTPVIMAMVLENFPDNRSLANGVYMAVNFTLSSLGILLVGRLGDLLGLRTTFLISIALIPLGLPFIYFLPKSK